MRNQRLDDRGQGSPAFSVTEAVIAVALLLTVAAIAIPNYWRSRIAANEASAIGFMRKIDAAEATYQSAYWYAGYAAALANLGGPVPCRPSASSACLIDEELSSGYKQGYKFSATGGNPIGSANTTYIAGAAPASYNSSGVRRFCSLQDQVLRSDPNMTESTIPPDASTCSSMLAMP